jgi:thiamine biosynthesis lipoprotein
MTNINVSGATPTTRLFPHWLACCFLATLALALLNACSEQGLEKLQGAAQGTTYHISYWSPQPPDIQAIATAVETEFAVIDKILSNYRPDSVIEEFNETAATDSYEVGPEIAGLIRLAATVSHASQGCYDLTVKPIFDLWGFQHEQQVIPPESAISKVLKQIGMDKLEIVDDSHIRKKQADVKVDVSSIAQGYSVERISQLLERHGIQDYLIEIGGELKTHGHKPNQEPWRIALEKPLSDQQSLHKVITLPKDTPFAVMTSGTYRHYFDNEGNRFSHILDARTGRPVQHDVVSVTVINPNPTLADAWSTALLCLGESEGLKAANGAHIAALFIRQQGGELIESRSAAMNTLPNVAIQ